MSTPFQIARLLSASLLATISLVKPLKAADAKLLNVSYDVTREFYGDYNKLFADHWKSLHNDKVSVSQSHGGSSKQARAVLAGLEADVVTFNQSTDIDILVPAKLVAEDWKNKFPHNASPYSSTILFLVRKGNPKAIKDWPDLIKERTQVIIPNPKTSGNGRYSYIAAWAYALEANNHDEGKARSFVAKLFGNVPVLPAGGRDATTTFAQNGIGDVLLTFENEVHLAVKELGADKFEVVVPSLSILAEAPVAVVEPVVAKNGNTKLAHEYLTYLFSDEAQELAARHYYRPDTAEILARHSADFPKIKLLTVDEAAGGWQKALTVHFKDGGVFDQINAEKHKQ